MLYSTNYAKASAEAISLRSISRTAKSKAELATIAAGIIDNRLPICDLSMTQIAILFGVSPGAVKKRRARRGGGRGKLTLAEHLLRASPAERLEAARALGVDAVWDSMIAPALT